MLERTSDDEAACSYGFLDSVVEAMGNLECSYSYGPLDVVTASFVTDVGLALMPAHLQAETYLSHEEHTAEAYSGRSSGVEP